MRDPIIRTDTDPGAYDPHLQVHFGLNPAYRLTGLYQFQHTTADDVLEVECDNRKIHITWATAEDVEECIIVLTQLLNNMRKAEMSAALGLHAAHDDHGYTQGGEGDGRTP
jgi:hypothetical protein